MIADERVDLNIVNPNGVTALMLAADKGHAPVVNLLICDQRVDPTLATQQGGTVLMHAAQSGHTAVVKLLLADERVDPSIANQDGFTALMLACKNGHSEVGTRFSTYTSYVRTRLHTFIFMSVTSVMPKSRAGCPQPARERS